MFESVAHSINCLLTLIIVTPLLGSAALAFVPIQNPNVARVLAGVFAALTFFLSIILVAGFDSSIATMQFTEAYWWMPELGVRYAVGVDGISLWLVALTTMLSVIVIIASVSIEKKVRSYLAFLLLLETGMLGTFFAVDGLTFYVFWELMLIPMYFLIGVWGGQRKIYAALKFFIYTAFGSLLMLVAIIYLAYAHSQQFGVPSFYLNDWMELSFTAQQEMLLFLAFALAFSIKIPLFPFHTWLPDAHVEAPTGGSVILAGVLLKMGLYGLIRFAVPIFPYAAVQAAPYFAVLAVVGIVFGALVAWVQTDIKKLVAYSSVSHLGFCVLGFAAMNIEGMQGCMLQMLNHGVSTAALFLIVGVLYDRKHSRLIADYGGLAAKIPIFSFVFLVFTMSSIGLPLTNGFIGEFLIMLGGFKYNWILGAIAVSGVVLGAIYMLSLYRRVVFGQFDEEKNGDLTDLNFRELVIFTPLLILVFVIGLKPQPILASMEAATSEVVAILQSQATDETSPDEAVQVASEHDKVSNEN